MQLPIPYCGPAPNPEQLLLRWNLDPLVLALLAIAAVWVATTRTAGVRRGLLAMGWATLAIAFVSPLCALSSALFSARVADHALLVAAAAPSLAWGLPEPKRRGSGPGLWTAAIAHAAALWVWHAPAPYAAALASDAIYWLMQASLLASGLLFWRTVREASPLAAGAALLGTMMQMGLLGALITFAGRPLYTPHLTTTAAWGLSPLADQQLAGLAMWVPLSGVYLVAGLALVGRALRADTVRSVAA